MDQRFELATLYVPNQPRLIRENPEIQQMIMLALLVGLIAFAIAYGRRQR